MENTRSSTLTKRGTVQRRLAFAAVATRRGKAGITEHLLEDRKDRLDVVYVLDLLVCEDSGTNVRGEKLHCNSSSRCSPGDTSRTVGGSFGSTAAPAPALRRTLLRLGGGDTVLAVLVIAGLIFLVAAAGFVAAVRIAGSP